MKTNIQKIVSAAAIVLFASASVYGKVDTSDVKPIKTTVPQAFEHEVGKTITMRLFIDEHGKPQQIEAIDVDIYDELLAKRVERAVENWLFSPAHDESGSAKGVWVDLPVKIKNVKRV